MNNLYIEKLKVDLYRSASNVNDYAEQKDNNRNHTNYGSASTLAGILITTGNVLFSTKISPYKIDSVPSCSIKFTLHLIPFSWILTCSGRHPKTTSLLLIR